MELIPEVLGQAQHSEAGEVIGSCLLLMEGPWRLCSLASLSCVCVCVCVCVQACVFASVCVCVCVNQRSTLDFLLGDHISFSLETGSLTGLSLAE